MSKQIEIVVVGAAGSGRGAVVGLIQDALKRMYGQWVGVSISERANSLSPEDVFDPSTDVLFTLDVAEPKDTAAQAKVFIVCGVDVQATRVLASCFEYVEDGLIFTGDAGDVVAHFPGGQWVVQEDALIELVPDPCIKIGVDTSSMDFALAKADLLRAKVAVAQFATPEPLEASSGSFVLDPLEQAIEAAVRLKADAKGADVARLGYHLEHLLALQLEKLTTQYRKPVGDSDWDGTIYGGNKRQAFERFVMPCATGASLALGSRGIDLDPKIHGA